uniref:Uncharacterized protein n=1 Tax=Panagrolaimus sp. PS1159 TaxID=55785 RepID=A0AC35G485_9BILA
MAQNNDAKPTTSDEKYYSVPESEWKFGYDPKSEGKTRIILTDKKDSTFVRYFDKDSNNGERYFCVGCLNNRRLKNCAELMNDKLAAPKFHDCTKISKDICEEEQKELGKKFKESQRKRASSASSNDTKSCNKLKAIPKSSKPSTSSSSSPIILGLDSPKKTKSFASKKKEPNTSRSSSPIIVNLTPSPLPRSNSGKAKASTYRRIRTPFDDSSPESTPVKSHQEQVEERKLRLEKRRLLDQKENENSYAESMNQKAETDEDEIAVLEPEKVSDFEDHPESFNPPSFPLHGETPFFTDKNNSRGSSSTWFPFSNISSMPSTSMSTSDINEFREVDCMYANYGFNENGEMKKLLIVREEDRTLAREYTVIEGKEWKCVNCLIGKAKKNENGNFLVSIKHECAPIPLVEIQEAQNKYGAKNKIPGRSAGSLSGNKQRSASRMSSLNSNVQKVHENNTKNFAPSTTQFSSTEASSAQVASTKAPIPVSSSNHIKIPSNQWEWGFDATGHEKMRIIVYASNDKERAYEYRNGGRKIICLGCHKLKKSLYATRSDDDIPIISVPPDGEHICKPRNLKEIREQQTTLFKKGKKRPNNKDISTVAEHGISKRTRKSVTKIEQDPELSANVEDGDNGNAFCDDSITPEPFPSTSNSRAETLEEQNKPMAEVSDANASLPKIQTYALSNCSTNVEFYYPSSGDTKKCCEKLGITFSQAIKVSSHKFWGEIIVTNVGPASIPNVIYHVSSAERTGYSCFSLFLTGTVTNALEIKKNFLENYFFKNLEKMGRDYYGKDFSSISDQETIKILLADDLTKYHLQALSDFFECRIGVFVDGNWERYGNWNDETANIFTFLMKKEGDKFSPILSMM